MKKIYTIIITILLMFILQINLFSKTMITPKKPFIVMNYDKKPYNLSPFKKPCTATNLNEKNSDAFCRINFIKDKDLNKKGKYLKINYNIEGKDAKVGYFINFKGLDLTFFNKLSFHIKGDKKKEYPDSIKVVIATWNDKIFHIVDVKPDWTTQTLDIEDFYGDFDVFNWEGIEYISFIFEHSSLNKKKGAIYIDDIKLLAKPDTSISLKKFKLQKYLKPRSRLQKFPEDITKKIDLNQSNEKILRQIAKDTWAFFKNTIDKNTYLVMDNITVHKNLTKALIRDFTNITNIGLELLVILSAHDLGYIDKKETIRMLKVVLDSIKKFKSWEGLYYNYYLTKNGKVANKFISSVDNGWLAAGLICLRNSLDGALAKEATEILQKMNFNKLYNPKLGQLYLGYDTATKAPSRYNYGLICTEPRIASLIAIGKGDVPEEHWFKIGRTLPVEWNWQKQRPQGKKKTLNGTSFLGGYYTTSGIKYVPSWGGSMFETMMPLIVLNEKKWAPESLGKNNENIVKLHIKLSKDKGYKYWGFSPCSVPESNKKYKGYHEFGIPELGASGYEPEGIVTPHAVILALLAGDEKIVMENLKNILKDFPKIYGEFGLYDSVDINTKEVTKKYLSLDQGMILVTLCNYLNNGSIQKKFEKDPIFQNVKDLISIENFFE